MVKSKDFTIWGLAAWHMPLLCSTYQPSMLAMLMNHYTVLHGVRYRYGPTRL